MTTAKGQKAQTQLKELRILWELASANVFGWRDVRIRPKLEPREGHAIWAILNYSAGFACSLPDHFARPALSWQNAL